VEKVRKWPNLTPDTAADFVKNHKANGANYIKLMQENCCSLALPTNSVPVATLELQTAVVKAAHEHSLPVVGHALSVDMTEIVLKSGADGLTHTFVDQAPPRSIIDLYKTTGAFVIPTLTVLASLTAEIQEYRDKFADIAYKKGIVDDFTKQNMQEVLGMKDPAAKLDYAFQTITQLKKEGIDVVAGTDAVAGLKGTGIGPSLWMEMELYVEKCGFTATDALHSATALPAKRFGFTDRGEVTEGKRADLVLVKGNVTKRLQDLWEGEGIVGVWKEGFKAG
jgi:imidazolonepropionase-like amidohydrolase